MIAWGIRAHMAEPHISLDASSLTPVERKLQGALEDQLTSALRAATDRVTETYAGEPVDAVTQRLYDETRAGLHPDIADGWSPDPGQLRQVAEVIVERQSPTQSLHAS